MAQEDNMTASVMREDSGSRVITLGILLILLGIGAFFVPSFTSVFVTLAIGAILMIGGVFKGIQAFFEDRFRSFLWKFLLAVVYVIAGVLIVSAPVEATRFLTFVLAALLLVSGIIKIVDSVANPGLPDHNWVVSSGVVSLLLAALVIWLLPTAGALWVIGVAVGIELILTGLVAIRDGVFLRRLEAALTRAR